MNSSASGELVIDTLMDTVLEIVMGVTVLEKTKSRYWYTTSALTVQCKTKAYCFFTRNDSKGRQLLIETLIMFEPVVMEEIEFDFRMRTNFVTRFAFCTCQNSDADKDFDDGWIEETSTLGTLKIGILIYVMQSLSLTVNECENVSIYHQ